MLLNVVARAVAVRVHRCHMRTYVSYITYTFAFQGTQAGVSDAAGSQERMRRNEGDAYLGTTWNVFSGRIGQETPDSACFCLCIYLGASEECGCVMDEREDLDILTYLDR